MSWDFTKIACEGMSDGIPLEKFDPKVLDKGTKVETKEHGEAANPNRIAADHIFEHGKTEGGEITSEYYDELDKMENKLEKSAMNWDFTKKEAIKPVEKPSWEFTKEATNTVPRFQGGTMIPGYLHDALTNLQNSTPEMQELLLSDYAKTGMSPEDITWLRGEVGSLSRGAAVIVDAAGLTELNRIAAELAEAPLPVASEVSAEDAFKEVSNKIKTLASGAAKNIIKDSEKWATLTALYQSGKDLKDKALQEAIQVLAEEAESAQGKAIEIELDRLVDEGQKSNAKNIFVSTFTSDIEKALPRKVEKAEQESKDAQELAGNSWEGLAREVPMEVEPVVTGDSLEAPVIK